MPSIKYDTLFAIVLAAFISFLINNFLVNRADLLRLIDEPNHRSSHSVPTPKGGGLGILLGFTAGAMIIWLLSFHTILIWIVLILGWMMAAVGFHDDVVSSPAILRLGFQMLAMALLMICLHHFAPYDWQTNTLVMYMVMVVVFFSGIWLINLYNFMDGTNGFAASETIFVMLAASAGLLYNKTDSVAIPYMMILASACFGFLLWNFPRGKIFMGDTGSIFLGFITAFFAMYTIFHHQLSVYAWLIWLSVFWVDASYTLIYRMFTGQRWYQAHRSHLFQILARRWRSHTKVVIAAVIYNIVWLLPLSLLGAKLPLLKIIWLALAVIPVLTCCICLKAGKNNH
jgi:Fuc2NAc and GlcNAc transferase